MAFERKILYDAIELAILAFVLIIFMDVGNAMADDTEFHKRYLANHVALTIDSMMAVSGDAGVNVNIEDADKYATSIESNMVKVGTTSDERKATKYWSYYHPSSGTAIIPSRQSSSDLAVIKEGNTLRLDSEIMFEELSSCPDIKTPGDPDNASIYIDLEDGGTKEIARQIENQCKNCILTSGSRNIKPDMIVSIRESDVVKISSRYDRKSMKLACKISNSLTKSPKIKGMTRTTAGIKPEEEGIEEGIPWAYAYIPAAGMNEEEKIKIAELILSGIREYYDKPDGTTGETESPEEKEEPEKKEQPKDERVEEEKSEPNAVTIG